MSYLSHKELPHNISAEAGIICTLIHKPEFILHSESLKPSYFYRKENGAIYWAIQQLYQDGIDVIDEFNINTKINSNKGVKNLVESVSKDFIGDIIEKSSYVARGSIEEYKNLTNIVINLSFKRDVYKKLQYFQKLCLDEDVDLNQLNLSIVNDVDDLSSQYVTQDKVPMYNKNIYNIWESIKSKRNPDKTYGLLSKHKILEQYFTYQDGELILVAARRKHGKSIYGMNELVHMLKQDIPCVYIDTEMNDEIFTTRLLSHLVGIEEYRIKSGNYTSSEEILINDGLKWINEKNFTHIYDPQWTREKLYITLKVLKNKMDFKFLIYDYIKVIEDRAMTMGEQYNELGNWCNFLKNNIAGGLGIPVLTFAQLNRRYQVADSDKVERYASTGIKWIKKTPQEIQNDSKECGNYKMNIFINRLGEEMDENEYINFTFDRKSLSIDVSKKQHDGEPEFMS